MTKTMLVDVGREESFITITNDHGHGSVVRTDRVNNNSATSFYNLARRVYDSFFDKRVDKLVVDKNRYGIDLIDQLELRFEENGYAYDYKKGTVQAIIKDGYDTSIFKLYETDSESNSEIIVAKHLESAMERNRIKKIEDNEKKQNELYDFAKSTAESTEYLKNLAVMYLESINTMNKQ